MLVCLVCEDVKLPVCLFFRAELVEQVIHFEVKLEVFVLALLRPDRLAANKIKVFELYEKTREEVFSFVDETLLAHPNLGRQVEPLIGRGDKIFFEIRPLVRVGRLPHVKLGVCVAQSQTARLLMIALTAVEGEADALRWET